MEPKIDRLKRVESVVAVSLVSCLFAVSADAKGLIEFSIPIGILGINLGRPKPAAGEADRSGGAAAAILKTACDVDYGRWTERVYIVCNILVRRQC